MLIRLMQILDFKVMHKKTTFEGLIDASSPVRYSLP